MNSHYIDVVLCVAIGFGIYGLLLSPLVFMWGYLRGKKEIVNGLKKPKYIEDGLYNYRSRTKVKRK